jgi:hypothetical protein
MELMSAKELFKGRKLVIATPFYNLQGYSPYIKSLVASLRLCWEVGIDAGLLPVEGDSYIGRARNSIMTQVYDKTDTTDLIFIDSDESWEPEDVLRLMMSDKAVVGGTYPLKNNWARWSHTCVIAPSGAPMGDAKTKELLCVAIPAGFMRISRKAMDLMAEAYPEKMFVPGSAMGKDPIYEWFGERFEDSVFCQRYRDAGGEIWLQPNLTIKHYGTEEHSGNYSDFLQRQPGGRKHRSSDDKPLVSVVIPCYNYGKYLGEAIESVLNQTYANIEIIIVNDGSTDNSFSVAYHYSLLYPHKVSIINQANRGVSAARNAGTAQALGKWIMCLDADDKITPTAISRMVDAGNHHDIIGCAQQTFGESNEVCLTAPHPTTEQLHETNQVNCAALHLRDLWEKIGGWDETMKQGFEDWDFWLRASRAGFTIKNLPEPLHLYRKHGHSMIDNAEMFREELTQKIRSKGELSL